MDRLDEVDVWSLFDPPAVEKISSSTLPPNVSATSMISVTGNVSQVQSLGSESMASFRTTDMKLMPFINNVDMEIPEIYDHRNLSFDNDLWVQFVIITAIAFVIIFLIVLIVILTAYALPSTGSFPVTARSSRKPTESQVAAELNPMLTSNV